MRRARCARALVLVGLIGSAGAAPTPGADREPEPHLLIVSGLGGESYYSERFERWAHTMAQAAERRLGLPAERITVLSEAAEGRARATVGNVQGALERLETVSRPGDLILVLLVGHGTAQGERASFNLPGPDLSPQALARMLEPLHDRRLAIVNAAPASAPFISALSAPGRIVVSATATETEDQHTVFAGHFADAFATAAGDRDKDGRISLLEAFLYAEQATRRAYEADGRLVTEHPLLEDNGDGAGTRAGEGLASSLTAGAGADGALAARFVLRAPRARERDVERLALDAEARRLVEQVSAHARLKSTMHRAQYEAELEALLVELALNRRIAEGAR